MAKEVGTWSRAKGNLSVTLKKYRKDMGRWRDYKAKYLGDPEAPVTPADVEKDLRAEFGKRFTLVPTSSRGGKILEA